MVGTIWFFGTRQSSIQITCQLLMCCVTMASISSARENTTHKENPRQDVFSYWLINEYALIFQWFKPSPWHPWHKLWQKNTYHLYIHSFLQSQLTGFNVLSLLHWQTKFCSNDNRIWFPYLFHWKPLSLFVLIKSRVSR